MEIGGIQYRQLLRRTRFVPGDKITLGSYSDNGRFMGKKTLTVLEVYRHHVVLDFGKYKESRRIADIALGLAGI